jgi:hypothetical protein
MKLSTLAKLAGLTMAAGMLMSCMASETLARREQQLAEYCADARNARKDLCAINTEIESTRSALAVTDGVARDARARADRAQQTADGAVSTANMAMSRLDAQNVNCETATFRRSATASCPAGTTLVSCSQSRYWSRAGGLTPMREINDSSCRFAGVVLEIKARCCTLTSSNRTADASMSTPTRS